MAIITPHQSVDPRAPIYKLRRRPLWLILQKVGIKCSPDHQLSGPGSMQEMASNAGIDVMKFDIDQLHRDHRAMLRSNNAIAGEAKVEDRKADPSYSEMAIGDIPDFNAMKMHELKAYAKQRGIITKNTDKKADILRKLNGDST